VFKQAYSFLNKRPRPLARQLKGELGKSGKVVGKQADSGSASASGRGGKRKMLTVSDEDSSSEESVEGSDNYSEDGSSFRFRSRSKKKRSRSKMPRDGHLRNQRTHDSCTGDDRGALFQRSSDLRITQQNELSAFSRLQESHAIERLSNQHLNERQADNRYR